LSAITTVDAGRAVRATVDGFESHHFTRHRAKDLLRQVGARHGIPASVLDDGYKGTVQSMARELEDNIGVWCPVCGHRLQQCSC
jgi:hypothetical protein